MRFIPSTFMQSGDCVKAYSNGSASGSFLSGSDVFQYHEWKLSDRNVSETYQLVVTQGFTSRARAVLIAGGGGGGWDGTGTFGKGGGGGGGQVIDIHNVQLYPTIYSLRIGRGGLPADADHPTTPTYNGGDGDYTEINGGSYTGGTVLRAIGGDGGYGDISQTGTYLHGGDSGNGFTGGLNEGIVPGGGAGASGNGIDGDDTPSSDKVGNGGPGVTITLPFTSTIWGSTSKAVAGGGGGGSDQESIPTEQGFGTDGGGDFTDDGERYTGGGGGGGRDFPATPPAGEGTQGGDGVLILYYPITNCTYFATSASFFEGNGIVNACESTNSVLVYYGEGNSIDVGTPVYRDILFEYPYSSTYLKSGSEWFYISGSDGIITSKGYCPVEYTVYFNSDSSSACNETTPTNIYSTSNPLEVNSVVYYDSNLTNPVTQSYFANGNELTSTWYFVSESNGVITSTGSCDLFVSGAIVDVFVSNTGSLYSTSSQLPSFEWVTSSMTLEVWSKNPAIEGTYDTAIGLNDQAAGGDRDFIEVRYRDVLGDKLFGSNYDGSTDTVTQPYGSNITSNIWYHSILTWDSGSGQMLYYRDGSLLGSGSVPTITTELNNPYYNVGKTDLGIDDSMYIGEFRIYPFAFNASQSLDNYNATKGRYGY